MSPHVFNQDYQSCMQKAAYAYLERHEAQYLTDSDLLFENCVQHLLVALAVPSYLAQRLTHHAWNELQAEQRRNAATRTMAVDLEQSGDGSVVHLVDTRTNLRYCVSARFLPLRLLAVRRILQKHICQ